MPLSFFGHYRLSGKRLVSEIAEKVISMDVQIIWRNICSVNNTQASAQKKWHTVPWWSCKRHSIAALHPQETSDIYMTTLHNFHLKNNLYYIQEHMPWEAIGKVFGHGILCNWGNSHKSSRIVQKWLFCASVLPEI